MVRHVCGAARTGLRPQFRLTVSLCDHQPDTWVHRAQTPGRQVWSPSRSELQQRLALGHIWEMEGSLSPSPAGAWGLKETTAGGGRGGGGGEKKV